MMKDYLEKRRKILNEIIKENQEKYDHNQIVIYELKNQIRNLEHNVDEASEIFSVKVREDSGFKKQEISEMEGKIAAHVIDNAEYESNMHEASMELEEIAECLEELQKHDVSRETLEEIEPITVQSESGQVSDEQNVPLSDSLDLRKLVDKLIFCKNIAEIDGARVRVEIDKLLQEIAE